MRFQKQNLLKNLLLLNLLVFLLSCASVPNVPACTAYPAASYYTLLTEFEKLCNDDPVCKVGMPSWLAEFNNWTPPTDHGWCINTVDGKNYDVDAGHPFPGNKKTWPELAESFVMLPAKESWAPIKTYIQTGCHENQDCDDNVGDWQSNVDLLDQKLN